jgi:hypothetical protein
MVNNSIDTLEMLFEESVTYFKPQENLKKISRNNGSGPATLPIDY